METCKHSWGNYDEYPDGLVETSCHLCGFTRRGRFVDNLRDAADLEADGLRGRLALAIKALERIEKMGEGFGGNCLKPDCESFHCLARRTLEQLKK